MGDRKIKLGVLGAFVLALLIGAWLYVRGESATLPLSAVQGPNPQIVEPNKRLVPTLDIPKVIGWAGDAKPAAAPGLKVNAFARDLQHPRWLHVLPNGDVLIAESNRPAGKPSGLVGWFTNRMMARGGMTGPSANRITLLRDTNHDGVADERHVLISGLNSPSGMALLGDYLYVANNDALVRFPYKTGDTQITAAPEKIVDLPAGGGHWARNVIADPASGKLYVAVGSATNIADKGLNLEKNRAAILEVDPKDKSFRVYAAGLRNPNGMAWEPTTKMLWTVVNERDGLGSDLVPDYLTSVQFGGFYGWPWYYWGGYIDARVPEPEEDMQQYSIRPDYALGAHVAALGLSFATGQKLAPRFTEGAFIGLHGSWNRRPVAGYEVIFVPFAKGRPAGKPVTILSGFLNADEQAQGRPVSVALDADGGLLVSDDAGNRIWRVTAR